MNKKLVIPWVVVGCLLMATVAFVGGQAKTPAAPTVGQIETRCGWFSNPTPANAWLYDRDGEWIIGVQGGYQAEGDWPTFTTKEWIKTNVNYGYGCACMRVRVNRQTRRVIKIQSASARPLTACRQDRALRRWRFR